MPNSPIPSDDLKDLTACDIARNIRAGEFSPTEVLEATIKRIELRNPSLNALIYLGFDDARASAKRLEARIAAGEDPGPFAGVPTAIKDLFGGYPGWPATIGGIRALKDSRSTAMSHYPSRMEAAGAIILGMTNSPVFGYRGVCDNLLFGPTRNPFDTSRNSGGSSGGSAAAVADGLLTVSGANDGGGSIRIPAAWCGVFGFQASYGRIPQVVRPNGFDMTAPFVIDGAVTRTVEDGALAAQVLAGYDPADPFSIEEQIDWVGATRRSIKGLRIGFSPNLDVFPIDPEVAERVSDAVRGFEEAGAQVEPLAFNLPYGQRELSDLWCRLVATRMAGAFDGLAAEGMDILGKHAGDVPDAIHQWIDRARAMSLSDLHRDQLMRTAVYDAFARAFRNVDLIVCPTVACEAVRNAENGETPGPLQVSGQAVDPLIGWCLTYLTNLTSHPSASVPAGLVRGLPVGLLIIGRPHADAAVLAASAAYERVRPWRSTYGICERRPIP